MAYVPITLSRLPRRGAHRSNKKIAINDTDGHVHALRRQRVADDLEKRAKPDAMRSDGVRTASGVWVIDKCSLPTLTRLELHLGPLTRPILPYRKTLAF